MDNKTAIQWLKKNERWLKSLLNKKNIIKENNNDNKQEFAVQYRGKDRRQIKINEHYWDIIRCLIFGHKIVPTEKELKLNQISFYPLALDGFYTIYNRLPTKKDKIKIYVFNFMKEEVWYSGFNKRQLIKNGIISSFVRWEFDVGIAS